MLKSPSRISTGFTLIEFVISLVVLAILVAAALPNMASLIQNMRIRTASESVYNGISLARMEAIRRNTTVTFWLTSTIDGSCTLTSTSTSWVVTPDSISPASACNATRVIQRRSKSDGSDNITVTSSDSANCIAFNGLGRVVAPTGCNNPISQLAFSSNSTASPRILHVRITDGGSIRMCDPDTNLSADDPRRC